MGNTRLGMGERGEIQHQVCKLNIFPVGRNSGRNLPHSASICFPEHYNDPEVNATVNLHKENQQGRTGCSPPHCPALRKGWLAHGRPPGRHTQFQTSLADKRTTFGALHFLLEPSVSPGAQNGAGGLDEGAPRCGGLCFPGEMCHSGESDDRGTARTGFKTRVLD